MSSRRSRMSLGPGSLPSALSDASGRANRRTSFGGGGGGGSDDEGSRAGGGVAAEPKKDRRTMLEEWRKARASSSSSGSNNNSQQNHNHNQQPPSTSSSAPSPSRAAYSYLASSKNKMSSSSTTQLSPIVASPVVESSRSHNVHDDNNNNDSFEDQQQQQQQQRRSSPLLPPMQKRPPSSAPSSVNLEKENPAVDNNNCRTPPGLSALERYRHRKQRQASQQQSSAAKSEPTPNNNNNEGMGGNSTGGGTPPPRGSSRKPPPLPPSHSSSEEEQQQQSAAASMNNGNGNNYGISSSSSSSLYNLGNSTPSRTRSKKSRGSTAISLGGAQRRIRRRTSLAPSEMMQLPGTATEQQGGEHQQSLRKPLLPPSYPPSNEQQQQRSADKFDVVVDEPTQQQQPVESDLLAIKQQNQQAATTATSTTFSQESHDSIDSAALKSRLSAMQKRIDNLEREKFELSMSKAPLEARIRQKEDAWVKERERLCTDIENYQFSSKDADEKYRELEMKNEALEEQNSRLRLEARANKSSAAADSSNSSSEGGGGGTQGGDSWSERLKSNNEIKDLRKEIKNKDDEIKSLRIEKVSLESEVFGCQQEIETLERNYDDLEKDYQELESSKSQNCEAEIQLEALTTEHTATTAQLNATCADLEEMKTRNKADLKAKEEAWKARESQLLFEMSVLKSRAGKSVNDDDEDGVEDGDEAAEMDPAILKARIEERDRRITELEEQLLSGEQLRRQLHNRIQELRGNIRVYVRTRPFLPNDGDARGQSSIDFQPDGESLAIQGKHVGEEHAFKFDKVFAPSTGQEMVFDEVSEFVQSALDGYNVCLFSYGQTGSGKTHTMQGSGNGAMRGIIPRAVEQILSQAEMMQSQRWTFTMKASFLEIYNEDLRDLLVMMNADGSMKPRDTRSATKLSIKRNAEGKSFVDGINMVDIDVENKSQGLAQLEAVITAASRARSVASTKMNAQSSRSHSVFMLHLCGSNEESGTVVQGALNLCDLAGSERLDRSGAASDARRLKETQAINKSLSCLGDVFTNLANGSKHIPFRNSKLTYLLQDCLSGDGKALMFVNLSPTIASSHESLCSLRFAQRVNSVELGKAKKNVSGSLR